MFTLILYAFLEATPGVPGVQVERIVAAEPFPTLELCQAKLREKAKDVKARKWRHMGGKCVPSIAIDSLPVSSCQVGQSWHITPDVQASKSCMPSEGR